MTGARGEAGRWVGWMDGSSALAGGEKPWAGSGRTQTGLSALPETGAQTKRASVKSTRAEGADEKGSAARTGKGRGGRKDRIERKDEMSFAGRRAGDGASSPPGNASTPAVVPDRVRQETEGWARCAAQMHSATSPRGKAIAGPGNWSDFGSLEAGD
nr:hypothetical protein CFP56_32438 [Quercus suber]